MCIIDYDYSLPVCVSADPAQVASMQVVRAMPNTAMLIGSGAGCYTANQAVTEREKQILERLWAPVGYMQEVPEAMMDAVCGLSGSGPAYVFMFVESLIGGCQYHI